MLTAIGRIFRACPITLFRALPPPMPPDAFPEISPLIAAAKADGIDARMVLARVLTDLFVGRMLHTHDELVQFEALVEPLIRIVDTRTAVAVADKLARHAETPRGVIEALLAREDEASFAMLRDAVMLDQRTLDILAERGSRRVAAAIAVARRPRRGDCAHPRLSRRSPDRSRACAKAEARSAAPMSCRFSAPGRAAISCSPSLCSPGQPSPFANAARSSSRPSRRNGPRSRPRRHAAAF